MLNRREFTHGFAGTAAWLAAKRTTLAAPANITSSQPLLQLQQEFMDLRFGMFLHLNMATFEQREWGDPKASPKIFNPAGSIPINGPRLPSPREWPTAA